MRAKSMVLLLIAGVCGLVASIGISQVLERGKDGGDEVPMGELFVAMTDIDIGAKLDATNVKLDKWPKDRVPEGAIAKLEDLEGKFPRVRLYAGEPILTAKLMDSNNGDDNSAKIPDGYRVVSVKVTMDEVVSGLVKPGDRVDVIFFARKGNEISKTIAQTILRDVRVFAINSETERAVDANGESIVAKTCSLLVKPAQVESVMLATELGKLRLSLRRPNDTDLDISNEGTDIEELLTGVRSKPEDKKQDSLIGEGSVFGLLNKSENAATAVTQPLTPPVMTAVQPAWRMTILTPDGNSQFQWHDQGALPEKVEGAADSAPPSTLPYAPPPTGAPELNQPELPTDNNAQSEVEVNPRNPDAGNTSTNE
jgi:pilus assembly protein CpaB